MGTSVSQRSPNTSGWRAVSTCYTHDAIPIDRTATEVWRAAAKQDSNILKQLGSAVVAECVSGASQSLKPKELAEKIQKCNSLKQNTVVGEFAKRALMIKAGGGYKSESSTSVLFRQLTNYLVSRDVSGYVGSDYRCKTVGELRAFKEAIGDAVAKKIQTIERQLSLTSKKTWKEVYPVVLERLQHS